MSEQGDNLDQLARDYGVLSREYGRAQRRCSELLASQAARIAQLEGENMRLRARAIIGDSQLAYARDDMQALAASIPGLPARVRLARRIDELTARVHDLMRELLRRDWFAQPDPHPAPSPGPGPGAQTRSVPADLREKSVLCIGHDEAGLARQVIEHAGGRFLQHRLQDGVQDSDSADDHAALEASLVAADLVICQTGCVSHDAYWRVQDHCKRTGKQCVLVERPQALHFVRSLQMQMQTHDSHVI